MLIIVVIKLTAPKIEDAQLSVTKESKSQKVLRHTLANGGYTVHPVPAPDSTNEEEK